MQIQAVLVAAMAAFAMAQNPKPPSCAVDCLVKNNGISGCSGIDDFPCLCRTSGAYNNAFTSCLIPACTPANDVIDTLQWKSDTCALYGIKWP